MYYSIDGLRLWSRYRLACHRHGRLRWEEEVANLVFDNALDDLVKVYFLGSPAPRSAWYAGLKGNDAAFANANTLAVHAWTEFTDYSGNRPSLTLVHGGAGSFNVNNQAAVAQFSVTGPGTIDGAFTCDVATGTAGLLYGGATFTERSVSSPDTISLTVTLSAESA